MQHDNEFYAYILGALLHDIGKFVQRAQKDPKKMDHCKWGDKWFEERLSEKLRIFSSKEKDIIRKAINTHHEYMEFISLADALSAGMDRIKLEDEEEKDPFTLKLKCIFSEISLSDRGKEIFYYPLKSISENLEEIFPEREEKCSSEDYAKLIQEFEIEIDKAINLKLSAVELVNTFYFLLWKYTWAIPSSAYRDEPDISLFDHLKTTSAITACLYLYGKGISKTPTIDSPSFLLLMGDVSGIQAYIFDVLTQQGKVAKRLRARSLYIQLLSEIASHRIIHQFGLPYLNILSSAGGNFLVLLPNLKNTKEEIAKLQKEFDEWTYNESDGELSISLAYVEATGREMMDGYSDLIDKLKNFLTYKKAQPFNSVLIRDNSWQTGRFLFERKIEGEEKACTGCRKHPIEDFEEELCKNCSMDIKLGKLLPRSKYIAFFSNPNKEFQVLNYSFELWDNEKDSQPYLIFSLNTPSPKGFKFIPNFIPFYENGICRIEGHEHKDREPLSFECIAELSEGDKVLAFLKGDADNMGKVFREGFKNTKISIARYCSLSRMLETFFSGYLNYKIKKEFKDIYIIFSGGDDFFIVGPWNRIIDFAIKLRKEYKRFVSENSDLTFSSGLILAKSHEPISFCAEMAEEELRSAKKAEGKDRIRLFSKNLRWNELEEVINEANRVIKWIEEEPSKISRSLAFNFREYGAMAERFEVVRETKYLKYIPLMVYDIERNLSEENKKEVFEWAYSFLPNQKTPYPEKIKFLRIVMEYVLKYTRR